MIGVYAITHRPSGRVYIGSSVCIANRWSNHRTDLNGNRHHSSYLQRVWSKYGPDEFEFTVLLETTRQALRREERRLIRERQPEFNCMMSLAEGPLKHDAATRAKMSVAQRRIWEERRAAGTDTLTAEHKARIAEAHRGQNHTDEAKAKMRLSARMRPPVSDETRHKLSEAGKRSQKGRVFSDEHRAKLSAARKGRKLSQEQKANIAAGLKRAYEEGRRSPKESD